METPKADLLIKNASEIITCKSTSDDPLGRISDGAVAVGDGRILDVGHKTHIQEKIDISSAKIIDASGKIVAPGFVDCHTHLVFGGSRVKEFALKMTQSIAEIEASGMKTGIPASIAMTRDASEDDLFLAAKDRLKRMLAYGTTTVESKSGYGIRWPDELKMLRVNQRLAMEQPVEVVSTFLGAHDFPLGMDREDPKQRRTYILELIQEMIPRVADEGLAEFCDIYCDTGYYTAKESEMVLSAGLEYGLTPKIHTDGYANVGGSALAAALPTVSADHLNYTTNEELLLMAQAGVVAVILPALDFAVAHSNPVQARPIIETGLTLALGTNLNPGNWTESMQVVMQLACRNHGLAPHEAMLASTMGAAKALNRGDTLGCLEAGYVADIQIWDLPSFEDIIYRIGNNAVWKVIKNGRVVVDRHGLK